MSAARHMIALLKSHLEGDDKEFLSVAMQAAAHEARLGHAGIAQQLRDLIDEAKRRSTAVQSRPGQLIVLEPRGELANLLLVQTPSIRLSDMALPDVLAERLKRVLLEQRQQRKLREHSLSPRRKLLFIGPSGTVTSGSASAVYPLPGGTEAHPTAPWETHSTHVRGTCPETAGSGRTSMASTCGLPRRSISTGTEA